jgi:hypothetical protein
VALRDLVAVDRDDVFAAAFFAVLRAVPLRLAPEVFFAALPVARELPFAVFFVDLLVLRPFVAMLTS